LFHFATRAVTNRPRSAPDTTRKYADATRFRGFAPSADSALDVGTNRANRGKAVG
jgi:hypothetical protein